MGIFLVEAVFGDGVERIVERCLKQAKTPAQYLESMRELGLFPQLDDPHLFGMLERELWVGANHHPFNRWVVYTNLDYVPGWLKPITLSRQHGVATVEAYPPELFRLLDEYGDRIRSIVSLEEELASAEQDR